jgi:hypothetical protein
MPTILNFLNKTFGVFDVRGVKIEPTYWQAGAIILLVFFLILTLARLRYIYVNWALSKGAISFLFYGFLLALILEGFLVLSGRTFMTEVLGWKNAPKPIGAAIDFGREKVTEVLGDQTGIPISSAKSKITPENLVREYKSLSISESRIVKEAICNP